MRDAPSKKVEAGRLGAGGEWETPSGARHGAFCVMGPCGRRLTIMASDGTDDIPWEHVSVSVTGKHPPSWVEMSWVKDQFWLDEETVLQFHPKKSQYVNCHPNCLHLWRNVGLDHPLPPKRAL